MIRRGEGGGRGAVWAFMVARGVGGVIVFPQHGSQSNRTRANIKAIPTPHRPPSPLRILMSLRLMRI